MSNIIQFPVQNIRLKDQDAAIDSAIERLASEDRSRIIKNECNTLSEYIRDLIEVAILDQDYYEDFDDMELKTLETTEGRDLFVIVNMINAMFLRHRGESHDFHNALGMLADDLASAYMNQNTPVDEELDAMLEAADSDEDEE
jgi:hypothetical protein